MPTTLVKTVAFENHDNDNFYTPSATEKGNVSAFFVANNVGVRLNSERLDVMCKFPDGSVTRPYLSTAIDQSTGKILYQSLGAEPESSCDISELRLPVKPERSAADCILPMEKMHIERYFASLERFLQNVDGPEEWDLHSLNDFAQTYADEIYYICVSD